MPDSKSTHVERPQGIGNAAVQIESG
jgi:hypothetical protein